MAANAWHVLRVEFKGTSIHLLLDGRAAIALEDHRTVRIDLARDCGSLPPLPGPGRAVG